MATPPASRDDVRPILGQPDFGPKDTRTQEERDSARRAYETWLFDLEHIERPRPLFTPTPNPLLTPDNVDPVTTVTCRRHTKFRATLNPGAKRVVIDLTQDDDDDLLAWGTSARRGGAGNTNAAAVNGRDSLDFYGAAERGQLRFQDRTTHQGQAPGPGMPRFDLASLATFLQTRTPTDAEVEARALTQIVANNRARTFEDSLQRFWLADRSGHTEGGSLLRGFPMVEDVVFYRAGNNVGTASNCFWKAVAYHVYGDSSFEFRVRAEHLTYFTEVLAAPQHPKFALYTQMNARFYSVEVANGARTAEIVANLYQLMFIPNCYQPMDMFEITADLYSLFTIVYDLGANPTGDSTCNPKALLAVRDVTMRGSYNDRHVFFLFVGDNHFQPMVPNDYIASEFRLPRPTWASTYGYPATTSNAKASKNLSTVHPWRTSISEWRLLDRANGPTPVTPMFDEASIKLILKGQP